MRRTNKVDHMTTWTDVALAVGDWQRHYGIDIEVSIRWKDTYPGGGFVEVRIREGNQVGQGQELQLVREAWPAKKMTGHPGAVLWAVSSALRVLESEPWSWSLKMRRDAQKTA